jgi:hypothetical protein
MHTSFLARVRFWGLTQTAAQRPYSKLAYAINGDRVNTFSCAGSESAGRLAEAG